MKTNKTKVRYPRVIYDDHPKWVRLYETACEMAIHNATKIPREEASPLMACVPNVDVVWQWDSCFMALFSKYSNHAFDALNNLDYLYRHQRDDGYISMAYRLEDGEEVYGERINPPLFAWVEWENYLFSNDRLRLSRIYSGLRNYYFWLKRNRRHPDGLYWYKDSGSGGMDNAPRGGRINSETASDLAHVDLACQQVLTSTYLGKIAVALKFEQDVEIWKTEFESLRELINRHHWCESHGFYYDVFARRNEGVWHNFTGIKTIASFWPILCQVANPNQTQSLIRHLLDPAEFWTPHPIASLSASDPNYDALGDYWRGGVWAPTNYMIARGLQLSGHGDIARKIGVKHLDYMSDVMDDPRWGGIWECYAPEKRRPSTKSDGVVRPNFVGWSGLGPIAMLIEQVMGLEFNAPANTINWRLCPNSRHGVDGIMFNDGQISLIYEGVKRSGDQAVIRLRNSRKVTLIVHVEGRTDSPLLSEACSAGEHEFPA